MSVRAPAFSTMMSRPWFCLLLLLGHSGVILADEPAVFTPPQAYPASRYEAGWNKNPFTLKTVMPLAVQDSFARDLAIGAHYGAVDNPTVVIVNTKTNERTLLRKDRPAQNGMHLKSVHVAINRNECQAEIVLGSQAAVLTYDSHYLGQLASSETSRMAAANPTRKSLKKDPPLPPLPTSEPKPAAASSAAVIASRHFSPSPQSASGAAEKNFSSPAPERVRFASPPPPKDP